MPVQRADDAGRQMRRVWLGAPGLRWPMDWTFEEWGVAFVTFLAGMVLFIFAVPAGLVVAAVALWAARKISRLTAPEAPRRTFWVILGCVAVLCLLISAHPGTWVRPLFFPFALLAGFVLPVVVVRLVAPLLDWNRPIGYWLRLPLQAARGPRLQKVEPIDPTKMLLAERETGTWQINETVVPAIILPPTFDKKVEKRLVPLDQPKKAPKHKMITKTDKGFIVRNTEYRVEWTF